MGKQRFVLLKLRLIGLKLDIEYAFLTLEGLYQDFVSYFLDLSVIHPSFRLLANFFVKTSRWLPSGKSKTLSELSVREIQRLGEMLTQDPKPEIQELGRQIIRDAEKIVLFRIFHRWKS